MEIEKLAVLGAGGGGHAMAADLALAGVKVNLFEFKDFEKNIAPMKEKGSIEISGVARNGQAKLELVTTDLEEAISDVSHIMVVTQSLGHNRLARELKPILKENQVIFMFAGSGGGLLFVNVLGDDINDKGLAVVENITLPYACRVIGPAQVRVSRIIPGNQCGVFPAKKTNDILAPLGKLYPSIYPAKNILEVALLNPNVLLHPVGSLFNIGRIEYTGGDFYIYSEGFTPSVKKIMEAIDREKMLVMERLGLTPLSFNDQFKARYNFDLEGFLEMMAPLGSKGPFSSRDRYISEDVPIGMVFLSSMAKELDVETPVLDGVINICSAINDENYWQSGRTAASLGLEEIDVPKLNFFLEHGKYPKE